MSRTVLIIGSGLAGYTLAREVRKLDPTTRLVILSRDAAGFYSKPMLSNALSGNKTATSLVMKPLERMVSDLDATIRPRVSVCGIDPVRRNVVLENGEILEWDDLVLALGADPIRLPLGGNAAADVLSVNDLDDFARFAEKLEGSRRIAVLGGGLIGCEFANDLLARDIEPLVIDIGPWPLGRLLPEDAARWFQQRLEAAGVRFGFGVSAEAVDRCDGGYQVKLSDGEVFEADLVLSAVGLRPRTGLAEAAGLEVRRGVVTNALLATSAPHIYAIGDCAEVRGLNLPFVMPIMHQCRALAATLSGNPTPVDYPAMPVVVKTPACPTVVCPPAAGSDGNWQTLTSPDDQGMEARFIGPQGTLLGFALLGEAVKRKQELASETPKPLAP